MKQSKRILYVSLFLSFSHTHTQTLTHTHTLSHTLTHSLTNTQTFAIFQQVKAKGKNSEKAPKQVQTTLFPKKSPLKKGRGILHRSYSVLPRCIVVAQNLKVSIEKSSTTHAKLTFCVAFLLFFRPRMSAVREAAERI